MTNSKPPGTPEASPQKQTTQQLAPKVRQDLAQRLATIQGHIQGIDRMLDAAHPQCIDILRQLKAVQGALGKASDSVLQAHLKEHVATAAERGTTDDTVDELMELLKYHH